MRLLLTSTGWKYNPKIKEAFLNLLEAPPSKTKVLLLSISERKDKKNISYHLKELKKIGIKSDHIQIARKKKIEKIRDLDVIYVCGGNTFLYMYWLKKSGLEKIIKQFAKKAFYFGISAGSIIAGKRIDVAEIGSNKDKNLVDLRSMRGLGLVPYVIHPHYTSKDEQEIRFFEKSKKCKVIRLTDTQALVIADFNKKRFMRIIS